jgi:hypothetical protein
MNKKRHKLRLRKQVIICIPILFIVIILTIGLIVNKASAFTSEILQSEVLSSNKKNQSDMKLSDLEYFKTFQSLLEKRQKDNTIIYYAQIFKLDVGKTLSIAHQYTNEYTSADFNKNFIIGPESVKNKLGSLKNFEAGAVYFTRDLYRYPEKYGTSIEEIRTSENPTLKAVSEDGNIYMDNGMTFEQYVGKICDLFDIDKTTVLAISYQEAGNKTSNLFRNSNNIGGHRGYSGWMKYTTLEAGVIAHVISVKAMQDNYDIDITTPTGLASLSGVYVNGNVLNPQPSWIEKVTIFKNNINKKDLFTVKE